MSLSARFAVVMIILIMLACSTTNQAVETLPAILPAETETEITIIPTTAGQVEQPASETSIAEVISVFTIETGLDLSTPIITKGKVRLHPGDELIVEILTPELDKVASTTIEGITDADGWMPFAVTLDFSSALTGGWLLLYTITPRDASVSHLIAYPLSPSYPRIVTGEEKEDIRILSSHVEISDDSVSIYISGVAGPTFENTLAYRLCGPGVDPTEYEFICGDLNNTLAQGSLIINASEIGRPGSFDKIITFPNPPERPWKLVLYETSPKDGSVIHAASLPIP